MNGKEPTADGIMIIVLWSEPFITYLVFEVHSGWIVKPVIIVLYPSNQRPGSPGYFVFCFQNGRQRFKKVPYGVFRLLGNSESGFGIKPVSLSLLSTATGGKSNMKLVWFRWWNRFAVRSLWDSLSILFRNLFFVTALFFFTPIFFEAFLRLCAFPFDYNTNMQGFLSENKDKKTLLLKILGVNLNMFVFLFYSKNCLSASY